MPACLQTLCPESRTKAALPGTPRTLSLQQPPDPLREPCLGFSPPQHPPARSLSAGTDLRKLNAHLPKPLEIKIHHRCVSRLPPGKPGSHLFCFQCYCPISRKASRNGWFRVGGSEWVVPPRGGREAPRRYAHDGGGGRNAVSPSPAPAARVRRIFCRRHEAKQVMGGGDQSSPGCFLSFLSAPEARGADSSPGPAEAEPGNKLNVAAAQQRRAAQGPRPYTAGSETTRW